MAIQLDPKNASAFSNRGPTWLKKGDLDNAINDYNVAIQLDPTNTLAYYGRGWSWHKKGDLDKAITDYDEAIRLDPKMAFAFTYRGNIWSQKGEPDRAIKDFDEAMRLDPNDAGVYTSLAWLLGTCPNSDFRNGAKAVEFAKKACEMTAWSNAGYLATLAAAHAEAGTFQEAVKWQEKAIELTATASEREQFRQLIELYKEGKPYRDEETK